MKPVVRLAVLVTGVATVLGVRAWRENERGKQVWSSATDSLDGSGSSEDRQAAAHN
ncbi:hypothetical protein [Citricoccus sp. GCM10030269]|uniref:hypothetical protein n=1 Tax=Citricoccus sp. GCM10030269 TaxID=3273388 RepID=UPI00360FAF6E